MKNSKIWKILYTIVFALQLIAEAVVLTAVLRLNMLPNKFLIPVIALFVLGLLVTGLLLFIPSKKNRAIGRRVVACILAVAVIGLCIFALTAISKLQNTMDNITNEQDWESSGDTRQVFVLKDDPATALEDAAQYTFGVVENYDIDGTEGAIRGIEQQLGQSIATVSFATIPDMIQALYNGSCQAIIFNEGMLSILEEQEGYEDVQERIRLLYDAQLLEAPQSQLPDDQENTKPSEPVEQTIPTTPPEEAFDVTTTPFIMYVSGLDAVGSRLYRSRSDVNILMVVNPNTKQILLVNTPRDYFVPNPAGDGMYDKLTHCSAYGYENSLIAISNLYDIELNYYSRINFTGFKKLVDAVGGVDVYSSQTYHRAGVQIVKGMNHLDGEGALVFARERKYLPGGDNDRGKNQMKIIEALIKKVTSEKSTIITRYPEILESLGDMFVTSMSNKDISALVKMQLDDMAQWDIKQYAVTGKGGWEYTYSSISLGMKSWVMYQDEGRVEYGTELINRVMNGEVLTEEDVKYPG